MGPTSNQGSVGARIILNGKVQDPQCMALVVVELDIDQPDMCTATLNNTNDYKYTKEVKQGWSVEFKIGPTVGKVETIFKGEIVGLEPVFDVRGPTSVRLTAFNKLHRLTRERVSKTYEGRTCQQIVEAVATKHKLTAQVSGDVNFVIDHCYQQHQTDLEWILELGRRFNYEVMCQDKTLIFRQRKLDQGNELKLIFGKEGPGPNEVALERFSAKLNSSSQVKKVQVRGWNPAQNEEIVGEFTAEKISKKLGKDLGSDAAKELGKLEASYHMPVRSKEEADAAAMALLEEAALNYIVGEGLCKGDPRLKPGIVVDVLVDPNDTQERFNGKYYITGATHRYTHKSGGDTGGYAATVKVRRNAEGQG